MKKLFSVFIFWFNFKRKTKSSNDSYKENVNVFFYKNYFRLTKFDFIIKKSTCGYFFQRLIDNKEFPKK